MGTHAGDPAADRCGFDPASPGQTCGSVGTLTPISMNEGRFAYRGTNAKVNAEYRISASLNNAPAFTYTCTRYDYMVIGSQLQIVGGRFPQLRDGRFDKLCCRPAD